MKTKYFILAAVAGMTLASCSSDEFVGDISPSTSQVKNETEAINFGFGLQNTTRGDIVGNEAAKLLGNGFYVVGTNGSEGTGNPSETLVFDNYLVHYANNTAGTTESNTANWEYVGITPGTGGYTNWVKLSTLSSQTIKYWDFSTDQYDFIAFSTGSSKAVSNTTLSGDGALANNEIGVTKMAYGTSLADNAPAYTFYIPTAEALKNVYITDVTTVEKANYGNEVLLQFKNLGSKIRLALYETIPGYSVKDVKFYTTEGDATPTDLGNGSTTTAALISADATYGFSTKGKVTVSYPKVGKTNSSNGNYKKASVSVDPVAPATPTLSQTFGNLINYQDKEGNEASGSYLGRNITEATYAGNAAVDYYQVVFPVSSSSPLTLRVDYTLVAIDGSSEEINVYGAKAVVPATYTVWQPNYAYTYIFKISDKTNGWTDEAGTAQGLFPITFDAVVAEFTDAEDQQKTITTVATPSITTYQQYHDITKDEYSKKVKNLKNEEVTRDIYVRIINSGGAVVSGLSASNSLIYELSKENASEAEVMDALLMRKETVGEVATKDVKGRNGLVLTNRSTNIDNDDTEIINGVNDKPITVATTTVAKIGISALTPAKSYAYVYISKAVTPSTGEVNQYEPVSVTENSPIDNTRAGDDFYTLTTGNINDGTTLTSAEAPSDASLYFSVTTNGSGTTTYSYISPKGKTTMPVGCKKVAKSTLEANAKAKGNENAAANTFYFDKYITNDGEYAVKVIKIAAES